MKFAFTALAIAISLTPGLLAAEGDISVTRKNSSGQWAQYPVSVPGAASFLTFSSAGVPSYVPLTTYQSLDTQLTDLAGLSYAGNTLKVVRVNAGETAFELATLAGGGDALVADPLSQFAATTSAQLDGVINDDTGSGLLVFATSPELTSATVATSFYPTVSNGAALGDATHQWSDLFLNSGAVINFDNGDATLTHTANTLTLDGAHLHVNAAFIDIEDAGETITMLADGRIVFDPGANTTTLDFGTPGANRTITLPDATGTVALMESLNTSAEILANVGDETGSGALVFATSPTMVTPVLGVASATSLSAGTVFSDLFDAVGAVDMDYGSADITDHTFVTDGTGTAEIVLPAGSIDGTEILDSTVANADMADDAIDSAEIADGAVDLVHLANDASRIVTKSTAASYTVGTTASRESYGGIIYVTGAATITLPAVADGMSVTVITVGAVAVSVDPNAADKMVLDGVTLDDGDKATNTSTTGDMIVFTYYSADGWYAASDGWTDTGA